MRKGRMEGRKLETRKRKVEKEQWEERVGGYIDNEKQRQGERDRERERERERGWVVELSDGRREGEWEKCKCVGRHLDLSRLDTVLSGKASVHTLILWLSVDTVLAVVPTVFSLIIFEKHKFFHLCIDVKAISPADNDHITRCLYFGRMWFTVHWSCKQKHLTQSHRIFLMSLKNFKSV